MTELPSQYFKRYRQFLGFSSTAATKDFLAAKDVKPPVNIDYLNNLTQRLETIIRAVNNVIYPPFRQQDIDGFVASFIHEPKDRIVENGLIARLNNQGRRPEQVLFSWLRGYAFCEFFKPAFSAVFDAEISSITQIGEDDFRAQETFRRTPTADLELAIGGEKPVVLEVQCGFQGINDIKEHKIRQARSVYTETGKPTLCVHFDLFNGQVAFIRLDTIAEDNANFVARTQMEGQLVLTIDQNHFTWRLLDQAPSLKDMGIELL